MSSREGSGCWDCKVVEATDEELEVGVEDVFFDGVEVPAHADAVGEENDSEGFEENDAYFLAAHEGGQLQHFTFDALLLLVRYINHIWLVYYYNTYIIENARDVFPPKATKHHFRPQPAWIN